MAALTSGYVNVTTLYDVLAESTGGYSVWLPAPPPFKTGKTLTSSSFTHTNKTELHKQENNSCHLNPNIHPNTE